MKREHRRVSWNDAECAIHVHERGATSQQLAAADKTFITASNLRCKIKNGCLAKPLQITMNQVRTPLGNAYPMHWLFDKPGNFDPQGNGVTQYAFDGSYFGVDNDGYNAINWMQVAFGEYESNCEPGTSLCTFDYSSTPANTMEALNIIQMRTYQAQMLIQILLMVHTNLTMELI